MNLEKLDRMPDWPARMTADIAAMFMGVSKNTFLTHYRAIGVREGGNVFWARAQLERVVAKQFGLSQAPGGKPEDDSWDDVR